MAPFLVKLERRYLHFYEYNCYGISFESTRDCVQPTQHPK